MEEPETSGLRRQSVGRRISTEKTPLMVYCQQELTSEVKKLLRSNVSVNVLDSLSRTALHYCSGNKSTKIAAMLLNRDFSIIDVRDANGYTALQMAVMAGNQSMVHFLTGNGADARTRDNEQRTLIHWATVCGHVNLIDVLVEHGAYLSSTDVHSAAPMHYVAQMCGAADEDDGQYHSTSLTLLQKLISKKAIIDVLDFDLRTPLFWATSSGSAEACEMLVKAGCNLNHRDKEGLTALHCASARGNTECVDMLLKKKSIAVDVVDYSGCTALFYSVSLGHIETTRALLQRHRCNPNHLDYRLRSPAHCAAAKGSVECLRILKASGGDLWMQNAKGDYPIHEAALAHQNDAVKYLLGTRSESTDIANYDGRTCLHIAALTNNLPLTSYLVNNNASKKSVMTCGGHAVTPYGGAMFKHHKDCAELLKLTESDTNDYPSTSKTDTASSKMLSVAKNDHEMKTKAKEQLPKDFEDREMNKNVREQLPKEDFDETPSHAEPKAKRSKGKRSIEIECSPASIDKFTEIGDEFMNEKMGKDFQLKDGMLKDNIMEKNRQLLPGKEPKLKEEPGENITEPKFEHLPAKMYNGFRQKNQELPEGNLKKSGFETFSDQNKTGFIGSRPNQLLDGNSAEKLKMKSLSLPKANSQESLGRNESKIEGLLEVERNAMESRHDLPLKAEDAQKPDSEFMSELKGSEMREERKALPVNDLTDKGLDSSSAMEGNNLIENNKGLAPKILKTSDLKSPSSPVNPSAHVTSDNRALLQKNLPESGETESSGLIQNALDFLEENTGNQKGIPEENELISENGTACDDKGIINVRKLNNVHAAKADSDEDLKSMVEIPIDTVPIHSGLFEAKHQQMSMEQNGVNHLPHELPLSFDDVVTRTRGPKDIADGDDLKLPAALKSTEDNRSRSDQNSSLSVHGSNDKNVDSSVLSTQGVHPPESVPVSKVLSSEHDQNCESSTQQNRNVRLSLRNEQDSISPEDNVENVGSSVLTAPDIAIHGHESAIVPWPVSTDDYPNSDTEQNRNVASSVRNEQSDSLSAMVSNGENATENVVLPMSMSADPADYPNSTSKAETESPEMSSGTKNDREMGKNAKEQLKKANSEETPSDSEHKAMLSSSVLSRRDMHPRESVNMSSVLSSGLSQNCDSETIKDQDVNLSLSNERVKSSLSAGVDNDGGSEAEQSQNVGLSVEPVDVGYGKNVSLSASTMQHKIDPYESTNGCNALSLEPDRNCYSDTEQNQNVNLSAELTKGRLADDEWKEDVSSLGQKTLVRSSNELKSTEYDDLTNQSVRPNTDSFEHPTHDHSHMSSKQDHSDNTQQSSDHQMPNQSHSISVYSKEDHTNDMEASSKDDHAKDMQVYSKDHTNDMQVYSKDHTNDMQAYSKEDHTRDMQVYSKEDHIKDMQAYSMEDHTKDRQGYSKDDHTKDMQGYSKEDHTKDREAYSKEDHTKDMQAYSKEDHTKDREAYSKEDHTKDMQAYSKEDHTKDKEAYSKEDHTKDMQAYSKEDHTKDKEAYSKEDHTKDRKAYSMEDHTKDMQGYSKEDHSKDMQAYSKEDHTNDMEASSKEDHTKNIQGYSKEDHTRDMQGYSKEDHSKDMQGYSKEDHTNVTQVHTREDDIDDSTSVDLSGKCLENYEQNSFTKAIKVEGSSLEVSKDQSSDESRDQNLNRRRQDIDIRSDSNSTVNQSSWTESLMLNSETPNSFTWSSAFVDRDSSPAKEIAEHKESNTGTSEQRLFTKETQTCSYDNNSYQANHSTQLLDDDEDKNNFHEYLEKNKRSLLFKGRCRDEAEEKSERMGTVSSEDDGLELFQQYDDNECGSTSSRSLLSSPGFRQRKLKKRSKRKPGEMMRDEWTEIDDMHLETVNVSEFAKQRGNSGRRNFKQDLEKSDHMGSNFMQQSGKMVRDEWTEIDDMHLKTVNVSEFVNERGNSGHRNFKQDLDKSDHFRRDFMQQFNSNGETEHEQANLTDLDGKNATKSQSCFAKGKMLLQDSSEFLSDDSSATDHYRSEKEFLRDGSENVLSFAAPSGKLQIASSKRRWRDAAKHQRWAEKLESVKYIWYESENEDDNLPTRRSFSTSNSRDSSPERDPSCRRRTHSISIPKEYWLRRRSLKAYLARNPRLIHGGTKNRLIDRGEERTDREPSTRLVRSHLGSSMNRDEAIQWFSQQSRRLQDQMRIYGIRVDQSKPATESSYWKENSAVSSLRKSSIAGTRSVRNSLNLTLLEVFNKYKWWQKFCIGGLKSRRNLIQEYVRIFETKRLMLMTIQKAKKLQMFNMNRGPAVDRMLAKQLVEDFNLQTREEYKVTDVNKFENLTGFCRYLQEEILCLDEEEKLLKKLEKLLHLRLVSEIGAGELALATIGASGKLHLANTGSGMKSPTASGSATDTSYLQSMSDFGAIVTEATSRTTAHRGLEYSKLPAPRHYMYLPNTGGYRHLPLSVSTDNARNTFGNLNRTSSTSFSSSFPQSTIPTLPPVIPVYNVPRNTIQTAFTGKLNRKSIATNTKRVTTPLPVLVARQPSSGDATPVGGEQSSQPTETMQCNEFDYASQK